MDDEHIAGANVHIELNILIHISLPGGLLVNLDENSTNWTDEVLSLVALLR